MRTIPTSCARSGNRSRICWTCTQPLKTVTANAHDVTLPLVSVAVQVTLVVPTAKTEPGAGVQTVVTPGQLSVALGGA